MRPTIGRLVICRGYESNGVDEHPAIVTRVWGGNDPADGGFVSVNLTMFPDTASPKLMSSVPLFESREAASAQGHGFSVAAFWPDRA